MLIVPPKRVDGDRSKYVAAGGLCAVANARLLCFSSVASTSSLYANRWPNTTRTQCDRLTRCDAHDAGTLVATTRLLTYRASHRRRRLWMTTPLLLLLLLTMQRYVRACALV
jgi:hypothetical protein